MNSIFNVVSCWNKGAILFVGCPGDLVLSIVSVEKDGIIIIIGVEGV